MKVNKSSTKAELILQLEEVIAKLKENNSHFESGTIAFAKETQTQSNLSLKCIEYNFESDSKVAHA